MDRMVAFTVALGGVCVALLTWLAPAAFRALPMYHADSATYLTWDVRRPPLYPAILTTLQFVDHDLALLGLVQLAAFTAAAAWLAVIFRRVTGGVLLSAGLGLSIIGHPQVISYASAALPETLLMATMMLHLSALLECSTKRTNRWAAAAGGSLAAAILMKPAALGFAGGCVLLAWALWTDPRRMRLLGVLAVALALPLLAVSLVNRDRIGIFAPQVMGGYAMLGVTGTFMPNDTPIEPLELQRSLVESLAPIRSELSQIDSMTMYYIYSSDAYHDALQRSTDVILRHLGASIGPGLPGGPAFIELNAIGEGVSRATILRAPRAYTRHITAHLYALWMMPLVQRASGQQSFASEIERLRTTLPLVARGPVPYRTVPDVAYWPYKIVLASALLGSIVGMAFFVVRRDERWAAAAFAGMLVHGYFLLTAAAQTGLPRYALAAWPLTVTVVWGTVAAVLSSCRGRREANAPAV